MAELVAIPNNSLSPSNVGYVGLIPVRNLWLLMLYASDLFHHLDRAKIAVEENPDDIPNLVAEVLAHAVERRLKRNLSRGYQLEEAVLSRVRGRIDLLETERRQLLNRGLVACRFENMTINTPRNRFVYGALSHISRLVSSSELARKCRALASSLRALGVSGELPSRTEMSTERSARHDSGDEFMITAARLAFDLALPTETLGNLSLLQPDRTITWIRKLFEKAVAGFYEVVLISEGWRIQAQKTIHWSIEQRTSGIGRILPSMRVDVVLDRPNTGQRIVIDTKFNSVITRGWHHEEVLRSAYIYQIYAYLRSQEGRGDSHADHASGLLLHPAVGYSIDETVVIQKHAIRFATVNLAATAIEIRERLLQMVDFPF
jgi:5-methylcytosine-specific restriction enzyme subunit McrC